MASCSDQDLHCPACHDVFRDPVLLSCCHTLCRTCLQTWWALKRVQECPVCRSVCEWSQPPSNLALKNLCEAFTSSTLRSSVQCRAHQEMFKLFCLDDRRPVCLVCRDASDHAGHHFKPLVEAAQDQRGALQEALKPIRDKLKALGAARLDLDLAARHIRRQRRQAERRIKEQFEQLRHFLQQEEEARLDAVRQEEALKSHVVDGLIDALVGDMAVLEETVRVTEEELRAQDAAFLADYLISLERVQQCPLLDAPLVPPDALIDVAKHLGNLGFNVWTNMKDVVSYTPLILDPNSAHAELVVWDDLRAVRHGRRRQPLPENPERFRYWDSVLGARVLDGGRHSWTVEVGDSAEWELGVLAETASRQGFTGSTVWSVELSGQRYRAFSPQLKYCPLSPDGALAKVRIQLDWDGSTLGFYNGDTGAHIHTFTHNFTDGLLPYLSTRGAVPLKVLPVEISVTTLC